MAFELIEFEFVSFKWRVESAQIGGLFIEFLVPIAVAHVNDGEYFHPTEFASNGFSCWSFVVSSFYGLV